MALLHGTLEASPYVKSKYGRVCLSVSGLECYRCQQILPGTYSWCNQTATIADCEAQVTRSLAIHYISRESYRPREMYCGHARLCVCLSAAACLHYCTDPDVTWRSGRGCPLVVYCWADLQSVYELRCSGNTMEMRGRAQR